MLQQRLLLRWRRSSPRPRLVRGEIQIWAIAAHLLVEGHQRLIPVPVAQLLLQKLAAQILPQLVAIVAALLPAPQPQVAEWPAQLAHHLPQRHLLAQDGYFLVRDARPGG